MEAPDGKSDEAFKIIVLGCSASKLGAVFPTIVQLGLWRSAGCFLAREDISPELRRQAVSKAAAGAQDADLSRILPHCLDDQFDQIFRLAVEKGLWKAVGQLLARTTRTWPWGQRSLAGWADRRQALGAAVAEEGADDEDLSVIVLQCIAERELREICIKHAVVRGLWKIVSEILQREMQQPSDAFEGFILRFFAFLDAGIRYSGGLQRPVKTWALKEACKQADEGVLIKSFIPMLLADYAELTEVVLATFVKRKLWQAATDILQISVAAGPGSNEPGSRQQELTEDQENDDERLDLIMQESLKRGMWGVLKKLLHHGLSDAQLQVLSRQVVVQVGMSELPEAALIRGPGQSLQALIALLDTPFYSSIRRW